MSAEKDRLRLDLPKSHERGTHTGGAFRCWIFMIVEHMINVRGHRKPARVKNLNIGNHRAKNTFLGFKPYFMPMV